MSGLVGYGSSDEEDDVPPERPAKVGDCSYSRTGKQWIPTNNAEIPDSQDRFSRRGYLGISIPGSENQSMKQQERVN